MTVTAAIGFLGGSFAFGNVHLANPDVTRAMIDDVADARKLDES